MAKQKTTYESSDGREFKTQAEAERHDAVRLAKKDYEAARWKLGTVLLADELTADGERIEVGVRTLYCIIGRYHAPVIQECTFYWNSWDWQLGRNDRLELRFRVTRGSDEQWVTVPLSDMYANRDNARQAVIDAKRQVIKDKQDELAELERDPSRISVNY